jgi:hypothetical protein
VEEPVFLLFYAATFTFLVCVTHMNTKREPENEAVPDAVRQPAQENLADLIWHYYQGEQTEPFSKMLLLSLQAEKFELAIELLKLHKLDQIYGAIDQIAVKGIRALVKEL